MICERVLYNVIWYEAVITKGPDKGSETAVLAYDAVDVPQRRKYYRCDKPISRHDFRLRKGFYGVPYYSIIEETYGGFSTLRTVYY